MRISDWSSDVCSSDLQRHAFFLLFAGNVEAEHGHVRHARDARAERTGETQMRAIDRRHHHRHRIELVAERLGKTRIAFIAADAADPAAPGLDAEVATVAFGSHAADALATVDP